MHFKCVSEDLQEVAEQELAVYLVLYKLWELIHDSLLLIIVNSLVSVVTPFVVEVSFDSPFKFNVKWNFVIELLDQTEKACKVISIFEGLVPFRMLAW